jgi:hypothetical protein
MNVFLEWNKCKVGTWCTLSELDLDHEHFDDMEGVYVIWYGEESPVALRVGCGYVRNCLANERNDKEVWVYRQQHELYVTWGKVGPKFRDGVAKYVASALQPELESSSPDVEPIEVNIPSPWYEEEFPWE